MASNTHVLIRKLSALHHVSEEEQRALLRCLEPPRTVPRGQDIVADASEPPVSTVILSGIACRYKELADGRRQILIFQYPGDVVDLYSYVLKHMDHAVGALTACEVASIPHRSVEQLCRDYPNLAYTLWRDTLLDTAMANMAIVNNGTRRADERIAHVFCEQVIRLEAIGLAERARAVRFDVTQSDIADATGLSLVHVNKTLRKLREQGLITLHRHELAITDWEGLRKLAGFDPGYLHFKRSHASENTL
jgi:CRP-like cAMP-binding protein